MKFVEQDAASMGYTMLTIGVEAGETRNLAIYLHWGYDRFLAGDQDGDELVLFYGKSI